MASRFVFHTAKIAGARHKKVQLVKVLSNPDIAAAFHE
jgi:hypothetical protein